MLDRVLVTGAQGFIGRYVVAELLSSCPRCTILGIGRSPELAASFTHRIGHGAERRRAPVPSALLAALAQGGDRYGYAALDLSDMPALAQVARAFQPTAVIHLAGALRGSAERELEAQNVAILRPMLQTIAAACEIPPTFLLGSSGGVYGVGHEQDLPFLETHPCRPVDPYSQSKLEGEASATSTAEVLGLPFRIARIFNVVGPGQCERHLCGRLARELTASDEGELTVRTRSLETTRDYLDVRDVASAIRVLAGARTLERLYNVSSGVETAGSAIWSALVDLAGRPGARSIACDGGQDDVPRHCGAPDRLRALGWRPHHALRSSLLDVVQYYRDLHRVAMGVD